LINARIDETVSIGEEVFVGFGFIGRNAKIEKGVKIFPQVYVGESVEIGAGMAGIPG
jgi:UDP-3-O-[3-hydroxymyristoyl] glucosamine N-acyltransferase